MTHRWISAEALLVELQRQEEERAYQLYLRRQQRATKSLAVVASEFYRLGLQHKIAALQQQLDEHDRIIHQEEQAEKWAQVQAEQVGDWEYEQYRRWEERR